MQHLRAIYAPENVVPLATSMVLQATLRQLLALGRTAPTACGDTALPTTVFTVSSFLVHFGNGV
jgi:hypothetical protein